MTYEVNPSARRVGADTVGVNLVTFELVDLFEILSNIALLPGHFGDTPPNDGDVFFEDTAPADPHGMQVRIEQVLGNAEIPADFWTTLSGNVVLHEATYSGDGGESVMSVIQDAIDGEFPAGVGTVYCNRHGQLAAHGRYARFDPEGHSGTGTGWDFRDFLAGDGHAVNADPDNVAHIRSFSYSRDVSKVINRAQVNPKTLLTDLPSGRVVNDLTSQGKYGIRSFAIDSLLTKQGVRPGGAVTTDWVETKTFAQYFVDRYATVKDRISSVGFRPMHPDATGAAANWDLLARCDLNDRVTITLGAPGGGGFTDAQFFIEGIHEQHQPLSGEIDDVTLTLDLSPADYYQDNPWT